jgi:Zn-dependent protease with chaperone function
MNKIQKLVSLMAVGTSLMTVAPALASSAITNTEILPTQVGTDLGLPEQDIRVTIARIIRIAMGMLGIIAVVIILIGGFTWMTAGGNDEKIAEAKKWIFSGIIGLAIILSSYAIATFVINSLISATTGTGAPTP